ncbi:hypothetical protein BJV82DRAFT_601638 [Fennellomyces sp. T-0311]|nr:hypothetical protein BJV82DRAFT_601638 [Fennellomyces sp. T-0311]
MIPSNTKAMHPAMQSKTRHTTHMIQQLSYSRTHIRSIRSNSTISTTITGTRIRLEQRCNRRNRNSMRRFRQGQKRTNNSSMRNMTSIITIQVTTNSKQQPKSSQHNQSKSVVLTPASNPNRNRLLVSTQVFNRKTNRLLVSIPVFNHSRSRSLDSIPVFSRKRSKSLDSIPVFNRSMLHSTLVYRKFRRKPKSRLPHSKPERISSRLKANHRCKRRRGKLEKRNWKR